MIDELYRRLGPPRPPRPIDWPFAEQRLGTALPAEVKALVDRYGPGHLGGVIELLSPEEPRSARNLVVQVRRNSFETSPIGLLVLANDADGRPLRWQRIGEPDAWPILIDFEPVVGTLAELLLAALDGRGPLPLRTGPPPPEPEPDVRGVDVAAALRAMTPRRRSPRAIDELARYVAPRNTSEQADAGLPSDARALIERYGSGELQDELFLFSPDRVEQALDAARAMQPHFPDPVTDEPAYRVWPEPGGLSPTRRGRRARRTRRPRA
jgi:hypothetical protein